MRNCIQWCKEEVYPDLSQAGAACAQRQALGWNERAQLSAAAAGAKGAVRLQEGGWVAGSAPGPLSCTSSSTQLCTSIPVWCLRVCTDDWTAGSAAACWVR